MKNRALRTVFGLAIAVVAVLGLQTASAIAAPTPADQFGIGFTSPGDAGDWFGNHGAPIWWFNQDFSVAATPTLWSHLSTSTIVVSDLSYSYNGSALTSITAVATQTVFSAEGLYGFVATGANDVGTVYEGTKTVGIDKTRPTSSSNLVPVYYGSAEITITATDLSSGPEYVLYTLDGAPQYAVPSQSSPYGLTFTIALPTTGPSFDVGVQTAKPGMHTLSWFAVDNAGNHGGWRQTTFLVNAIGYVPVLSKPTVLVDHHRVTFRGSVTAATRAKTVILTVQRKHGSAWRSFATYSVPVAQYKGHYSIKQRIAKNGTYRVKAAELTGASHWSTQFKVR